MQTKKFLPLFKNILTIVLVFLIISGVFSLFALEKEKIKNIDLAKLVDQVNQEQVEQISINGAQIDIILRDGQAEKTFKEEESSLTDTLKNLGAEPLKLQKIKIEVKNMGGMKFWLGVFLPFILPTLLIIAFFWWMLKQAQKGGNQVFGFTRSLAKMANSENKKGEKKITFKDVAGLEEAKDELQEVVDFLKSPQKFTKMGAKIPKGVLLVGPPGTGKTLLARATANEAGVPFLHMSGSEFVELFVGVGAARTRDLFETAKKSAPCIIFLDELDAIGRHRGAGVGGGHDEREQTLNQILVEMDGFDTNKGIIVMAATNRPDILDPALLRPGRFDRKVILNFPDINARHEILKIHCQDKPLAKNVDLRQIAERIPGFSGADIANLANEAAILTAKYNKKEVGMKELINSIEKVMLGPERKSYILSPKEKEIAAYHEAGHALIAASLPHTDTVRKISIIARGQAAGYTLKLPTEDKHLHSKSEFISDLSVLLGGYSAEKIIFNEITTGAGNDLERASDLARKLVTQYGMSDKMGPMTFGDREELIFLGKEISEQKNYSEKVAAEIDEEVSKFIKDAYKKAQDILIKKKPLLTKIAQRLIEKETIEKEEFEELISPKPKNKKESNIKEVLPSKKTIKIMVDPEP